MNLLLNSTNGRIDSLMQIANTNIAAEQDRATSVELSLALSVNTAQSRAVQVVGAEQARAMTAETGLSSLVTAALTAQQSQANTLSSSIAAEALRATNAENSVASTVAQTQFALAQTSAAVAGLQTSLNGQVSTAIAVVGAVIGGQQVANMAAATLQYSSLSTAVNTASGLLSTSIASIVVSSAVANTALQAGLSSVVTAASAALLAALLPTQASTAALHTRLTLTNTSLQTSIATIAALSTSVVSLNAQLSAQIAITQGLSAALGTTIALVSPTLQCSSAPAAVANGVVSQCANMVVGSVCVPACNSGYAALLSYTCMDGGVWIGSPACGNGQSITSPLGSCLAIRNLGYTTDGVYYINPGQTAGWSAFPVYCDMTTDGGGWALAVVISGTDQLHSQIGQFAFLPITPTSPPTYAPTGTGAPTSGWLSMKLADTTINRMMSNTGRAQIRFVCDGSKHFVKNCVWSAVRGLPSNTDPCVVFYADEAATVVQNSVACNAGSQGVGSHCSSTSPPSYTYCSHCINGEAAYFPAGRLGCGHDTTGYGKQGQLWVR